MGRLPRRLLLGTMLGALAAACARARRAQAAVAPAALWPSAAANTAFPLTRAPGQRYLAGADGAPFLMHGDTAWSLIAQLTREDALRYLDDRAARGVNTILVSLIERYYADGAPNDRAGQGPFTTPGDYATPNEAYMAHAEWALREAGRRGMLVLLTPSYHGWIGGHDGWYAEMLQNGPEKLRAYGRYLGARFGALDNILWVNGGDGNAPNRDVVRAIANGIRDTAPAMLQTAHCDGGTGATDYYGGEPWLDVDTVYSSLNVYDDLKRAYEDEARLPFFFIEGIYENEQWRHIVGDAPNTRRQAYTAYLCGAFGQVFGNSPIWHFNGHPERRGEDWRGFLNSRGAQDMTRVRNFMSLIPWTALRPDFDRAFLVRAAAGAFPVAAAQAAGAAGVVYAPQGQAFALNLETLGGAGARLRWYDPADGTFRDAEAGREEALFVLRPPGRNAGGERDWVLLAQAPAPG